MPNRMSLCYAQKYTCTLLHVHTIIMAHYYNESMGMDNSAEIKFDGLKLIAYNL